MKKLLTLFLSTLLLLVSTTSVFAADSSEEDSGRDSSLCGDNYCSETETSASCPADCGEQIDISGIPCTDLESDTIKEDIPRGVQSVNLEPQGNRITQVNTSTWDTITNDLTNLWKNLRPPYQTNQDPKDKFSAIPSKITIEGQFENAPADIKPVSDQKIGIPESYLGKYNKLSETNSSFIKPPNLPSIVANEKVDVTSAPTSSHPSQGQLNIPWSQRLVNLVSGAFAGARDWVNQLFGVSNPNPELALKVKTCTPYGIQNVQNTLQITQPFRMPNLNFGKDTKREDDSVKSSFNLTTSAGSSTSKDINVKTYGTAQIRDSLINTRRVLAFNPFSLSSSLDSTYSLPTTGISAGLGVAEVFSKAAQSAKIPLPMLYAIADRESSSLYARVNEEEFKRFSTPNWWVGLNNDDPRGREFNHPDIVRALAYNTCQYYLACGSGSDVRGLMQFLKSTFNSVANRVQSLVGREVDFKNMTDSIYGAAFHLRDLGNTASGSGLSESSWDQATVKKIARAYCAGSSNMNNPAVDYDRACFHGGLTYPQEAWLQYNRHVLRLGL
ncbi:MAG: hypothetical protein A3A61_03980 [Candidatus Woykebacteria bacterium RIFCSPLOWO2_01_FULL_43_14]|nr:MAG: hypothetical protein A3A61_03980 [Candidatus Woykebacteria bacterium RIFCSPLOWO2_01_FULL_43_14]